MKNRTILMALAALLALAGCRQKTVVSFDWDNESQIDYAIDYSVRFAADHDSTMQLTVSGNYGIVKIAQVESENLIGEDGKPVKNTFIILEDSVPTSKSITLQRGGLSYIGGKPEFIHNNTIGSDDMVEFYVIGTADYTLYSIRDNMFFGPDEQQQFTIPGGHRFSVVLPVMTEEMYPKERETHSIRLDFSIGSNKDVIQ